MRNAYIFFLFPFFMGTMWGTAQTTIEGTIRDSLGVTISEINVFLQSENNLAVIAFAYTDKEGTYAIPLDTVGAFVLNISGLSYKKKQIRFIVDSLWPQQKITKNVVLKSAPFALNEVVVNADIPILVKKDTITINTTSFTDGTEEVVEDILKKLPGIEVTKDGTVRVQGKSVEKVMVEGDDLFDKGYKLLTKNLNAGIIDKVEILEHFSDNALLKNIEDSDKVALNLTLKEGQKTKLFGNATAGYGSDQFYEGKLNLISFNEKTKYYFFGNLNNTGSDATGDIYQLIYPDFFTSQTYIGDGMSAQKLIDINGSPPNLEEHRLNFNNAELASLNGIYNPSKNLKIKGFAFFTSDENSFANSSIEEFFLPPNPFTNTENYRLRKKSLAGSGKLGAIYNLGKKAQIEYVGRYSYANFKDRALLLFNGEPINENLRGDTRFTDHRLTYTRKINTTKALQFTGRYIYDEKPQNYLVDTYLYGGLFPNSNTFGFVNQQSENQTQFFGLEGSYFLNKSSNNLSLIAGFTHTTNRLNSNLGFIDSARNINDAGLDYDNAFVYTMQDFYAKTKYRYTLDKFALRTGVEVHQFNLKTVNHEGGEKENPLTLVPSIGLSWQINKKNRLLTSYKYRTKNLPFYKLFDGYVLTNYRNFKRGSGSFQQLKGSFFLASYVLGNWSDSFLINTSLIYNKDHDYVARNSFTQANFSQSSPLLLKNREFYSLNFSGDRFIEPLSSNIKLNGSTSKNTMQNIVNGSALRTIETKTYTYGWELRSAFSGFFNFHLGTTWTTSQVKTSQENSNTNNISFFDLNFNVSERLSFQLKNESYYFGNPSADKSFYFADFNAQYDVKKNKLKLKLAVNNIFDTNTFSNFNISDTGSYSSSYQLLPRYVLLKMDYRF